jgi:hypothetical protein
MTFAARTKPCFSMLGSRFTSWLPAAAMIAVLLRTYARRTKKAHTTAADVIGAMSKEMLV